MSLVHYILSHVLGAWLSLSYYSLVIVGNQELRTMKERKR
jgi:hypothetical protein